MTEHAPAGRVSALPNQLPGLIERLGLTRMEVDRWVWLVEPAGCRCRGAAAVARVLREMGGGWRLLGWLARLPGATIAYRIVAQYRGVLGRFWWERPPY